MAYTSIDDPEAYFQVKLYTGNGGSQSITLDGDTDMQPDFLWIKERGVAHSHALTDAVRGVRKSIITDGAESEYSESAGVASLDSDGFTFDGVGNNHVNDSSQATVAWCWKESATAGFDIISYAGNATNRTISHNLSAVHLMIIKNRTNGIKWVVYHHKNTSAPETDRLLLNTTGATDDSDAEWNDTAPTSSVFTIGTGNSPNRDGDDYIAYLWSEKQGYSKFGGYTGNGAADGAFVYTGFRPAYLLVKRFNTTGEWGVFDHKRNTFNVATAQLKVNATEVEEVNGAVDFCANGFKLRETSVFMNGDGDTYVYVAFAEAPFVNSNGVPGNAR